MARHVVWSSRSDSQAEPKRQAVRDEAPVADEPGFYEPGRSPSLLLANWFWLHHIIRLYRRIGHCGRSPK
jgi:hypothetical protein